jgi:hypothetical protein
MSARRVWAAVAVAMVGGVSCAGRVVYYPQGCEDRLGSPYKRAECLACVARPLPHQYLPDNADGNRCFRR